MNAVHCDTTYLIFVVHAVFLYAFGFCHYFHTCSLSVVLFASISFSPSPFISVRKTPFDVFILTGCIVCIPSTQSTNICDSQMYVNTLCNKPHQLCDKHTHTQFECICAQIQMNHPVLGNNISTNIVSCHKSVRAQYLSVH